MYFKKFPTVYYPYNVNGVDQYIVVKDITINVRFVKEVLSNITLWETYDIKDGETPEIIAEKIYGSPLYHWIVMLTNERYDYINDFPLGYYDLEQSTISKYGADHIYDTHHYENDEGYVVDSSYPGAYEVSNFEYEERMNESKRSIKVIGKPIIEQIVAEFNKALS